MGEPCEIKRVGIRVMATLYGLWIQRDAAGLGMCRCV
jgi:hypothetical protein